MTAALDAPPVAVEIVSKRTLANRKNALKSTGPRTETGKAASRRNALKTGLAGKGVVLPAELEAEAARRRAGWAEVYRPQTQDEIDLMEEGVRAATLHDAAWRELELARARASDRAERLWNEDREAAAAGLVRRLKKAPARTVAKLRLTLQGTKRLVALWTELGERLELKEDWTPAQRELALDLLGIEDPFRDDLTIVDRHPDDPAARLDARLDLVADQLIALEDAIEDGLAEFDELDRRLVAEGGLTRLDPEVAKLVGYEERLARRSMKAMERLRGLKRANAPRVARPTQPVAAKKVVEAPAPVEVRPIASVSPEKTKPTPPPSPEKTKPTPPPEAPPSVPKSTVRQAERLLEKLPKRRR